MIVFGFIGINFEVCVKMYFCFDLGYLRLKTDWNINLMVFNNFSDLGTCEIKSVLGLRYLIS